MTEKATLPLTHQLRRAILDSGQSRYAIAKATGIDAAALCRFMQGAGLSMQSIDALGQHLGVELVARRAAKRRPKKDRPKGR
jgi:hypothetical protein